MTTTDTRPAPPTEFERIAALTIKATEAVAEELRTDGDAHTCVTATMGVFQPEIDRLKAKVERLSAERDAKTEMIRRIRSRHRVHRCKSECPCEGEGDGRICGYCQMPWPCPDRQDLDRDSADDALDLAKEMYRQRQRAEQAEAEVKLLRDQIAQEQADAWVVPKVPVDDNPHVRPYIRGGLIYRYASDAETPEQARRYAAQLLAAADEADAQAKENGQ